MGVEAPGGAERVPRRQSPDLGTAADRARALEALRQSAERCQACELYQGATRTVFGSGSPSAPLMLVGEQPGDGEDRTGEPFVGPAGRVLDEALADAGIDPGEVYVTNAVKHFRNETVGRRRLHQRPAVRHVTACRSWLDEELRLVAPRVVVCLGATAAAALLAPAYPVIERHGTVVAWEDGTLLTATIHPSAILRAAGERREEFRRILVEDLRSAAALGVPARQDG